MTEVRCEQVRRPGIDMTTETQWDVVATRPWYGPGVSGTVSPMHWVCHDWRMMILHLKGPPGPIMAWDS